MLNALQNGLEGRSLRAVFGLYLISAVYLLGCGLVAAAAGVGLERVALAMPPLAVTLVLFLYVAAYLPRFTIGALRRYGRTVVGALRKLEEALVLTEGAVREFNMSAAGVLTTDRESWARFRHGIELHEEAAAVLKPNEKLESRLRLALIIVIVGREALQLITEAGIQADYVGTLLGRVVAVMEARQTERATDLAEEIVTARDTVHRLAEQSQDFARAPYRRPESPRPAA